MIDDIQKDAQLRMDKCIDSLVHELAKHADVVTENGSTGMMSAMGQTNDIVNLSFSASTHTARTLNTGIEIDCNCRMRQIGAWLLTRLKTWCGHPKFIRPLRQFVIQRIRLFRHVRKQQLEHHFL